MIQHLAEPLNKALIKLVNKEADEEWAKKEPQPIPKVKLDKPKKDSAGWYVFVADILLNLRP